IQLVVETVGLQEGHQTQGISGKNLRSPKCFPVIVNGGAIRGEDGLLIRRTICQPRTRASGLQTRLTMLNVSRSPGLELSMSRMMIGRQTWKSLPLRLLSR